ncbi:M-phase phosphoprotein 6 [Periplaneta americana]|uniref:M-phase phosphoprotein 6 n=1 Tax=Periplaneta americana TaxID=6978 RepID=A0ABQ8SIK7_PERAM|nr:hypothetical protein ANN_16191 [Periplaneta americana]
MAFRDNAKQKLSKSILEMKFMKRSKEKAQREQEAEDGQAMFSDVITEDMKHGACKYIIEPSFVPCENLIVGRLAFLGMNPEIERIMELEEQEKIMKWDSRNEKEVSDREMAHRYNTLVGTVSRKFNTKRDNRTLQDEEAGPRKKKMKFLKPSCD